MKRIFSAFLLLSLSVTVSAKQVGVFCMFSEQTSGYEDEYVKISIAFQNDAPKLVIYNKQDRIIYVDKGNSFAYENDSVCSLFSNSVNTSTRGTSQNEMFDKTNVPAGVMADPAAEKVLLKKSSQNSTSIYEQRVLAIAPQSAYCLHTYDFDKNRTVINSAIDMRPRKIGRNWIFPEQSVSPYLIKARVRYSLSEDLSDPHDITVSSFVDEIVLDKRQSINNPNRKQATAASQYSDRAYCCYKNGFNWAIVGYVAGGAAVFYGTGFGLFKIMSSAN